jgi:hypothetical protein
MAKTTLLENQIHHGNHDHQEQYGHDAAGAHEIRRPVATGAHGQGIDLVRRDEEGIGCGNGYRQRKYCRVSAGSDLSVSNS